MSNKKSLGIVLKVVAFFVSFAIGFFVTPLFVSDKEKGMEETAQGTTQTSEQEGNVVTKQEEKVQPAAITETVAEVAKPVVEEIVLSYDPVVNNNYIYSFNAL